MRLMKLPTGGAAAQRESVLMVSETVKALADRQLAIAAAPSTMKSR